jgi:hypothetical protein
LAQGALGVPALLMVVAEVRVPLAHFFQRLAAVAAGVIPMKTALAVVVAASLSRELAGLNFLLVTVVRRTQ